MNFFSVFSSYFFIKTGVWVRAWVSVRVRFGLGQGNCSDWISLLTTYIK